MDKTSFWWVGLCGICHPGGGPSEFDRDGEMLYDHETGQLLTGSLMDYCLPRADDLPTFQVTLADGAHCTTNALGIKGAGESGTIAAAPAVMNALMDALAPLGIRHLDMPATPEKVWRAINAHGLSS